MTAPDPISRDSADGPAAQQAGYLYHKQRPEHGRRRTSADGRVRAARRRPFHHHDAAHKTLLANIRTFAVVAGSMFLLLLLALYIARRSWQAQQAQAQTAPAAQAAPAPRMPLAETDDEEEALPRGLLRSQLDTEAIRKAVFLAKRGKALEQSSDYREAIARYREALDIWPYLTPVWAQLGRAYMRIGDYARAQVALERAVEADAGSPDILNDLGVTYLYRNLLDKAFELFESAAEIDPQFPDSYFNIALCHIGRGKTVEAAAALDTYLRLRPNDPRALKEKAYLDASRGKHEDALVALKAALAEAPEWPPLYFDAAAASALMGRLEDALKYLEKAEALTSPAAVYSVYQQPAFREIRLTELGRMFEKDVAERARGVLAAAEAASMAEGEVTEPLSSVSSSP